MSTPDQPVPFRAGHAGQAPAAAHLATPSAITTSQAKDAMMTMDVQS